MFREKLLKSKALYTMEHSLIFSKYQVEKSLEILNSDQKQGLSSTEANSRLRETGPNMISAAQQVTTFEILIRQLKSVIVLLLVTAGIVSFFMGHLIEGFAVIAVLIVNTIIGFLTELKAVRSMEALKKMGLTSTTVLRDGAAKVLNAGQIVPGDIVLFEAGDIITADLRLIEASKVAADESILTGESIPTEKNIECFFEDKILAERGNILFKGTAITRGTGKGLVIATGMQTEVGKIVKVTQDATDDLTPLEKRLDHPGQQLIWVSIVIAIIVAGSGIVSGKDLKLMIETAIALAVATIPEGLPIVATLALAKGMWRMAKKNALIKKLAAVETLGATSIIFSDKTGTLTENKMTVRSYQTDTQYFDLDTPVKEQPDQYLRRCIDIGILCNNSSLKENEVDQFIGDPMEVALISVAQKLGIDFNQVKKDNPELKEVAFDSETLMMATYHSTEHSSWVAVKGAPEVIIQKCVYKIKEGKKVELTVQDKEKWITHNQKMSKDGLRVLGLAFKTITDCDEGAYEELILSGLVGLLDPARKDIKEAIESCTQAGITTIMVTGDQEGTAIKIGKDIGLIKEETMSVIHGKDLPKSDDWTDDLKNKILKTRIFCRVTPQQKFSLVQYFQSHNQVVAMTGDGVNDAPALKKADIGIAMGLRGTQVAKEAADMVLQDDLFRSIVSAIKQGRIIYSNIQRFVVYLLSCNISEILIISIAAIVNAPLPLMPLQILFLNLVTDVFPALALGMGEGDDTYLKIPPRQRHDDIITKRKWGLITLYGAIITLCVLTAFFYTLKTTQNEHIALTISFLSLGFAQVFHVFNMRLSHSSLFINDITKNIHVWGAVFLCIFLLIGSVKVATSRSLLTLVDINAHQWGIVLSASIAPFLIILILSKFNLGIKA